MLKTKLWIPIVAGILVLSNAARAEIAVVTSIKPIHSLVASVMQDVGAPAIIVDGAASPHTYSLRPSQAADLQRADVIFWSGPELEAFLEKPIEAISKNAKAIALLNAPGVTTHGFREGATFDAHDHDHGHGHDEAKKEHDHDHGHDHDKAKKEHDHDHGHDHHGIDPHVWLDPENAEAWVQHIAKTLSEADPANAARYTANAKATVAKLDSLQGEVSGLLKNLSDRPFIVFHDAYRYFEERFGVSAVGAITVSPDVMPGAARVTEIRDRVRDLNAACVFSEPQFEPRLVRVVTEGTNAKTGVLDPLGTALSNGPDLYAELIRGMAVSMRDCLSPES